MKYKVGDKVIVTDHNYGCCEDNCPGCTFEMKKLKGKILTVKELFSSGNFTVKGEGFTWSSCLVAPAYTGAFKVGDRVKVVKYPAGDNHDIGLEGTISRIDQSLDSPYLLSSDEFYAGVWAMEGELELVERPEDSIGRELGVTCDAIGRSLSLSKMEKLFKESKCFFDDGEPAKPLHPELNKLLTKKGGLMASLSRLAKKTFDPDTRALIEAGVLNQNLEVIDYSLIMEVVLEANKKAVAVLAREVLKERAESAKRYC